MWPNISASIRKNYNSAPTLVVNGVGLNCVLIPVIENEKIVDVIIRNTGTNYSSANTSIEVVPAGRNVTFETFLKLWTTQFDGDYLQLSGLV